MTANSTQPVPPLLRRLLRHTALAQPLSSTMRDSSPGIHGGIAATLSLPGLMSAALREEYTVTNL
jgi:hypothetical protein